MAEDKRDYEGTRSGQPEQGGSRGTAGSRGKPPRGYERSDARLREMICERLMDDGSIDASEVEIDVTGGCVKLEGTVDSRITQDRIEDVIESFGVSDVQNNLRVSRGASASSSTSGSTSGGTSQYGSSGGASSLGMSASGTTDDRTEGMSRGLPTASGTSGGSSDSKDGSRAPTRTE